MERVPGMTDRPPSPSNDPQRLTEEVSPSLLIVGRDADTRQFLRAGLRRWYQIAEADAGKPVVQHLTHCPPEALIASRMTAGDQEALLSALHERKAPPVLKLWARRPPAGWADETLRHPFTRADLQRAVDRLVYGEDADDEGDERSEPSDVRIQANPEP